MLLLATMAFGQAKEDAGDGKMLDKQTMEFKDYLPEIHGTIRGKYEYQTETSESRFEVRNARFSVSGNVHPIVAYKAEIDLSDEGSIKMLDAYARVFPVKDLNFTIGQVRVPFTIDERVERKATIEMKSQRTTSDSWLIILAKQTLEKTRHILSLK